MGEKNSQRKSISREEFLATIFYSLLYFMGWLLVFAGIAGLLWLTRPYFTLFIFRNKQAKLESKVQAGRVKGNRVIIPSILVDEAIVEGYGLKQLSQGVVRIPSSSRPGEGGTVVLEGHNVAEFGLLKPHSFFSLLELISVGSPVYVFYDGRKYIYRVVAKKILNASNPQVYRNSSPECLRMVTCVSTWSATIFSKRRLVVEAKPDFK
jgi:LPXTG-site transpeptidase (sortase) family protein